MEDNGTIRYDGEGGIRLEVKCDGETVWLNEQQMADLFGRDQSVIARHIRNVFREGELDRDSVYAKFAYTATDGKTYQVAFYNLDVVISVGYRVKSIAGTRFRQWATRKLRDIMMARVHDTRRIDRLETRMGNVEQGLADLAAEFDEWTIYPAHSPMGFGAAGKGE